MTTCVAELADHSAKGRLISMLEGGYGLEGLGSAAKEHVEELQGRS